MDDEGDGLKQNGVLGVGVLHLLGLGRLLGFVEDGLQTLGQATSQRRILCSDKEYVLKTSQPGSNPITVLRLRTPCFIP